jgi:hypothetical protein
MKINHDTRLTLKDGTKIKISFGMKDYSTGREYRQGFTTDNKFVDFTEADIVLPRLVQTIAGLGWDEEYQSQLDDLELSEEILEKIESEAMISWNKVGGTASYLFYKSANSVIDAINNDEEPSFPQTEWNEQFKIRHEARLKAGLSEQELTASFQEQFKN